MDNELSILEETCHPHIVSIYELLHDDNHYFIVSEFLQGGELYNYLVDKGSLSEDEVRDIVQQLYLALNYMHKNKIVHREIKPENILIDSKEDMSIKLTDFGFAEIRKENEKMSLKLGSPIYMAPEVTLGDEYDEKVDVWSAGVVTYILLSGKPPFVGED